MSLHISTSERIFPEILDKNAFIEIFSKEMSKRGYGLKQSRESGFDIIYSDFFGEAKIYLTQDSGFLRFGYRLGVSFLLFAFIIIFPLLDFTYIVLSAGVLALWTLKLILLKSVINECANNTYMLLKHGYHTGTEEKKGEEEEKSKS
ncbi:MAG: hypothetical protein DRJ30_05050 [Candidatus Methanomethylicota archaeon]|nr:MAG: hypothetical protein DRJ30_05050 [Candidatus Verstraetearchaeota archaeon]